MAESRNGSFYEGKTPGLVNVYEAYQGQKITKEEAEDLNTKFNPSKTLGSTGLKNGKRYPKTQADQYQSLVRQRKSGTGNYKYKNKPKKVKNG